MCCRWPAHYSRDRYRTFQSDPCSRKTFATLDGPRRRHAGIAAGCSRDGRKKETSQQMAIASRADGETIAMRISFQCDCGRGYGSRSAVARVIRTLRASQWIKPRPWQETRSRSGKLARISSSKMGGRFQGKPLVNPRWFGGELLLANGVFIENLFGWGGHVLTAKPWAV
jgi:hypothetical protein